MNSKTILQYAIGPIGAAAISAVSLPLLTWFFSVEDIGRISLLQVACSFSLLLLTFGLDQAYTREYHEYTHKARLLKTVMFPGMVINIALLIFVILAQNTLISRFLYSIDSVFLSTMSAISIILTFISRFLSLILRMQNRAFAFSMSQLIPKALFLIAILSSVMLGFQANIFNLITIYTISIVSTCLILFWNTKHDIYSALKAQIKWVELKSLIYFGAPLVIGGLASWGLNFMDRIFLKSLSNFTQLGVYSVTSSISNAGAIFAGIFNTIWAPMIFKWVKDGINLTKIDVISEHLLAAIYFITALFGIFSWILPYFLPSSYNASQYLITTLLLAPLFYTLSETTAVGISISRKTSLAMLASIVAMFINLVGNYILIPKYGAAGATVSTAVSFWFFYILRTEFSRKVWRNIPSVKAYITITFLLVFCCLNTLFFKNHFGVFIAWFIVVLIGILIFKKSLLVLLKYIKPKLHRINIS